VPTAGALTQRPSLQTHVELPVTAVNRWLDLANGANIYCCRRLAFSTSRRFSLPARPLRSSNGLHGFCLSSSPSRVANPD
jgi:hypothetical protein